MRLLIHTINYRPELTGTGKYTGEMCEWLAARGHQVTVVAPPPYYPSWRVAEPYSQWRYETCTVENVKVRRAPIWIPRRPAGFARILYAASFALSSFPLVLREAFRADIVFVIEPSLLNSAFAWIAARIARARCWLHIQDYEIDLAYDLGQLSRGRWLARAIDSLISGRFDVVSSISRRMVCRAAAKGVKPERLFLFPNFFDDNSIYPARDPNPIRERLKIPPDSVVALYSGSLGAKQGMEMILESAQLLKTAAIHFIVCGEGIAAAGLYSRAAGASNVTFLPLQPPADLNALLNAADIHLLPQRRGAAQSVLPSKLIGMLASGRPVAAMADPGSEIGDLVDGCGICVAHGDIAGFAGAIQRLATDPGRRAVMGRKARARALESFRQEDVLLQFETRLSSIAGNANPAEAAPELLQPLRDSRDGR